MSISKADIPTYESVKTWDDARRLYRHWRDDNIRRSKDVLELWETLVHSNISKFGDEKWLVYEQVYLAALDCNNISVAESCMYALRTQFPKSVRISKLIGMFREATGKYDKALEIYKDILEEEETNALVRKRMISCFKSQNKMKEYIIELNEYLKMFQADHEAWLELCDAYLSEMEYAKAAFCLEELILMNPHNHVYHQRFADIKYTQGNYEAARSYYAYSLKINPNNIRALYGMMLSTANLRSSQKTKDSVDNAKLNAWAKEQIEKRYADKSDPSALSEVLKDLALSK